MSILKKSSKTTNPASPVIGRKHCHIYGVPTMVYHQLDDNYSEPKKNSKIIYIIGQLSSSLQDLSSKRTRAKIHLRRAEQGQRNTRCNQGCIFCLTVLPS